MKNSKLIIGIFLVFAALLVGCSEKKWAKTTDVSISMSSTSNEVTIAGKQFVMDTILLQFTDMGITGDRLQAESVNVQNSTHSSLEFISGVSVGVGIFKIPQGTFEKMEMPVRIGASASSSVYISGVYFLPSSNTYDVLISLDIDSYELLSVVDVDNSSTILLEEGKARVLNLELDVEALFAEVNPGLWTAAAVTNINGSQTIQIDQLNNSSLYFALLAGVSNSLSTKFQ